MKTIATAAVLMMLSVPTWAEEQASREANEPANANEPIVLSEAEMDGVTGAQGALYLLFLNPSNSNTTATSTAHTADWKYVSIGDPGRTW